jgi:hypothetical protein
VRTAAAQCSATTSIVTLTFAGSEIRVVPDFIGQRGEVLNGPQHVSDSWPRFERRLLGKAKQALAADSGWLRVDVRDGLWQFTAWAQRELTGKATEVSDYLHPLLDSTGLDGIVLTSGACLAQGHFENDEGHCAENALVLRRLIGSARVRESIIIPLSPTGEKQAPSWYEFYNSEPVWLAHALAEVGLSDIPEFEGQPRTDLSES